MKRGPALYAAAVCALSPLFWAILAQLAGVIADLPEEPQGHMSGLGAVVGFYILVVVTLPAFVAALVASFTGINRVGAAIWGTCLLPSLWAAFWWFKELAGQEVDADVLGLWVLPFVHLGVVAVGAWAIGALLRRVAESSIQDPAGDASP